MSSVDLPTLIEAFYVVGLVLATGLGIYAAYWSLQIRRALIVSRYRRQALWGALVSLYFAIEIPVSYLAGPVPSESIYTPLTSNLWFDLFGYFVSSIFAVVVLFVWADSAVPVARRTDPLLRDPFRWKRTRLFLWAVMIWNVVASVVAVFSVMSGTYIFYSPTILELFGHVSGSVGSLPENPLADSVNNLVVNGLHLGFVPKYLVLAVAGVVLVVGGLRSTDANFRSSLRWFGKFVAVFLVVVSVDTLVVIPFGDPLAPTTFNVFWAFVLNLILVPISFYFVYRSARSLVPLNRLAPIETELELRH
jgi:hypothetical protein